MAGIAPGPWYSGGFERVQWEFDEPAVLDEPYGMSDQHTIGFLGCGNMGGAILEGMLEDGVCEPSGVLVAERSPERRDHWRARGVRVSDSPRDLAGVGTLLVAVKPQSFADAADSTGSLDGSTMVLSVMAGIDSAEIARAFGGRVRVVRAMPNTPCAVGAGISAVAIGAQADRDDVREAIRLMGTVGRVVEVRESELHAVTAVSGSGPAYLFLLAEAWIEAAIENGLDPAVARELVISTVQGAAELLRRDGDPEVLRAMVTSKGGTTAAGIERLEAGAIREAMSTAVRAARERSEELGRG